MGNSKKTVASFCQKKNQNVAIDWPLAKFVQKYKNKSVLFSKYGRTEKFNTETLDFHFVKSINKVDFRNLDSVCRTINSTPFRYTYKRKFDPYLEIQERYSNWKNYLVDLCRGSIQGVSMVRMWNVSMVGALIFGMFIMTFIYRYLGQGVSAEPLSDSQVEITTEEKKDDDKEKKEKNKEVVEDYVTQIMSSYQKEKKESEKQKSLEKEIEEMTKGYPIEKMAPYIAKQDKIVAAFLVAIAKKESNWGKRVPVLDGEDCYNYWGYRGKRERMGTGGHTCFDSHEDAVKTVAKRINFLVTDEKLNTPEKLVVWKCGYDCSWDNPAAVRKWISDVDQYYSKFDKSEE